MWEQLSGASSWVWQTLLDAPFRPREETLTEMVLIDLARTVGSDMQIAKACVGQEVQAGLDWAWALETPAGWITMFVQAKQVAGEKFGVYKELRKPGTGVQCRRLIRASRMYGALPVYAFFNGQVPPFGPAHSTVQFGACHLASVDRSDANGLPPWLSGASPFGVTLAHAQDVLDSVLPPPAEKQRAAHVNKFAMPWECFFCPTLAFTDAGRPRITVAAQRLARRGQFVDASAGRLSRPSWLRAESPPWAELLAERQNPWDYEDAPPASYLVRTSARWNDASELIG